MPKNTQKKSRTEREYVVELEEPGNHRVAYTLGTLGGLVLGGLLLRALDGLIGREAATRIRQSNDGAPARFRPGRLRRPPREQDALLQLEDAVLDAFLRDEVLSDRGIDVGVISPGIIELSGAVFTRAEASRALAVARTVGGVDTVVNRMDIEDLGRRGRPRFDTDEGDGMSGEWTGHQSGMGSRRQGRETDPARPDDSQHQREDALEQADRAQFADEGYHERPRVGERNEVQSTDRQDFAEGELDNQSPYGKHAVPAAEQPQALNSQARVGEGLKPGVELNLEAADVPVKPHGDAGKGQGGD